MDFLSHLFDTADFPPRWQCGNWSEGHGWLHVVSDLGIWSAYFAIPLTLTSFLVRRKDLPFRAIFVLFAAFILLCGATHLMEAVLFWWPAYRTAGVLKLITAIVSWGTVVALIQVAPKVFAMRTPEELEREIARRRLAEQALQDANAELERRVDERTRELSKALEERKQAEAALKVADRRKDEFLATMAHELRNPLAPIRSAVQVLKIKGPPEPDLIWSRDVIDRQVTQMARLLEDLLDVSRITRSRLELRKQRIALASVIENAVETSRPLIQASQHVLQLDLPREPVYLDADPVRLSQVFSNLLNNAAKYTETGGHIRLTVAVAPSTSTHNGTDPEVAVSVADDGVGISAENLPRIFEMFSQVTPAFVRTQGGLGIGLSLVKGLVELHGGRVEARSKGLNQGSEFIVHLPVATASVDAPSPAGEFRPVRTAARRIVVADDNRDGAESLALMLTILGHEVRVAHDGQEAVEMVTSFRPDIALLDIGMPRMNGHEAARRIRQEAWGKAMVLVALTGWGQEEDRRRSQEAGFDHHLVKPVDPATLQNLLAAVAVETSSGGRSTS